MGCANRKHGSHESETGGTSRISCDLLAVRSMKPSARSSTLPQDSYDTVRRMGDRNRSIMARLGAILLVALAVIVCGQLYAGDAERSAKEAACAEAKGVLTKGATGPATKDPDGADHRDQRSDKKDQAGREEFLVEAAARCAAYAVMPDRRRIALSTFLAAVGPFVGMMAFILAGLRYDAGMRGTFGGGSTSLEIEPAGGARGRRWVV